MALACRVGVRVRVRVRVYYYSYIDTAVRWWIRRRFMLVLGSEWRVGVGVGVGVGFGVEGWSWSWSWGWVRGGGLELGSYIGYL